MGELLRDAVEVKDRIPVAVRAFIEKQIALGGQAVAHQRDQIFELGDEAIVGGAGDAVVASEPVGKDDDLEARELREQCEMVEIRHDVSPFDLTKGGRTVAARGQGARSDRRSRRAGEPIF